MTKGSGSNKHFCEGCYEQHSVRRLDLAEIKSLTEQLDLPFVKALLLDKANQPASIRSHASSIGSKNGRCLSNFLQVAHEQQAEPVIQPSFDRVNYNSNNNNNSQQRRPASFHESHVNLLGLDAQYYYDRSQQYSPALRASNSPAAQGFYEPSRQSDSCSQHQSSSPSFAISPSFLQQQQNGATQWPNGYFFPNGQMSDFEGSGVRTFYNGPIGPIQHQLPMQTRYASTPNLMGENQLIAPPPPYLCRVGQYPTGFSASRAAYDGVR